LKPRGRLLQSSMNLKAFCFTFAILSGTASGLAQDGPGNNDSRIVVKSQLVVLDTVVTDRKGNVVTNLKRDDFQVYEDGALRTIRSFDPPADHPPISDVPVKDRNGNDNWGDSPLTMIVVDEMDTPFTEIAYAKECVERYLRSQPARLPEPTILLWLNDSGIHPITTFTRDRDIVLQAILKHPPSSASKLARGSTAEEIALSFSALQQAALFSRGKPGKKDILWVGRSFPSIDGSTLAYPDKELIERALHSTIDLLLASRVSVSVIDPTLGTSVLPDNPAAMQSTVMIEPLAAPKITDPFSNSFDMNLFVQQTGGKYYRGMNDLDREISDSVQRGVGFYTLSYVPPARDSPSEYHNILVRLSDPTLTAQTKQGYYSNEKNAPSTKQEVKNDDNDLRFDLYEATITGMRYTGVGLHVQQCKREIDNIHATCNISVNSGDLTFSSAETGDEKTQILAVLSSSDARGKLLNHTSEQLTLSVRANEANLISAGNILLTLHTVVPPGAKRVEVILRDVSGRIGTAEVNSAEVPNLVSSLAIKKSSK
jgi:VWFA-related protein